MNRLIYLLCACLLAGVNAETVCPISVPDAGDASSRQGLTGTADHILTMDLDEEDAAGDPDPDVDAEVTSLQGRAADDEVKTPAAVYWKCKDAVFGYLTSGKDKDVWALVYDTGELQ